MIRSFGVRPTASARTSDHQPIPIEATRTGSVLISLYPSPVSQKSLDGSFPFPCPFPCPGPDPGNVLSHDRLRWVFGAPSGTGTGTGTGTNSEAFIGLMALGVLWRALRARPEVFPVAQLLRERVVLITGAGQGIG